MVNLWKVQSLRRFSHVRLDFPVAKVKAMELATLDDTEMHVAIGVLNHG